MNLKLLSKLKASDSAQLVLIARPGNQLEYYLVSRSVVYDIICTGTIEGTIKGKSISFDIRMSSLVSLIDKGYKFTIQYTGKGLKFVTEDGKMELAPSYVESRDANTAQVIETYMAFSEAMANRTQTMSRIDELQKEISALKAQHRSVTLMHLSGGPSGDPFTTDTTSQKIDEKFMPNIEQKERELKELSRRQYHIDEIEMLPFLSIAGAASRRHGLVDMCGDYAICEMENSFLLQKAPCPLQSFQGQLLYVLLRDGNGKGFYSYNDQIIYVGGGKEKVAVLVAKYLPNNTVDSSIVTNGVVEEKYNLSLKGILNIASVVKSNFENFALDLGSAEFILTNQFGESLRSKFEIEDAKTVKMSKLMRGEQIQGDLTMATITVPAEVQSMLSLFKEKVTIYVKKRKIILQNDGLYLVFGR